MKKKNLIMSLKKLLKAFGGEDTDSNNAVDIIDEIANNVSGGSGSGSGNGLITLNLDEANVLTAEQANAFQGAGFFDADSGMSHAVGNILDQFEPIVAFMVSDNIPDLIEFTDDFSGQRRGYLMQRSSYQLHALPEELRSSVPSNYFCLSEDVDITIAIYMSNKQFEGNEYVKASSLDLKIGGPPSIGPLFPCRIVFLDKYPAMVPGLAESDQST